MFAASMTTRSAAQQRADRIRAFEEELAALEQEGALALTPEQRRAVREHHAALLAEYGRAFDIDKSTQSKQLSLGMRIVSFLGALAFGASVYFLYYRYWGLLTTAVQVVVLIAAALGSLALTVWLDARGASPYFTKLAALVALVCFVLDLGVLGQIFNIAPTDRAFVVWGALALLLAYAYDSPLLLLAGLAWTTVFLASRTAALTGAYWGEWMSRPENLIAAGALTLAVPALLPQRSAAFAAVYRVAGMIMLFIPVIACGTDGLNSYLSAPSDIVEASTRSSGSSGLRWRSGSACAANGRTS